MSVDIADLVATLRADDAPFVAGMARADLALAGLHARTGTTMAALSTLSLGLGAVAVGGLAVAVKQASNFDTMLAQVRNNTTMTDAGFAVMRQGILQMATQTNAPMDQLAQGFMHITNLSFSAKDALLILRQAMMSAASTGSNTADVSNILANVMHEYSMSATQAAHAMDVLHLASAQGNATLEQFSETSGKAIAMAANLGVPLTDVGAALAALTRHGLNSAAASTLVAGALSKILNPAVATQKELARVSKLSGIDLVGDFTQAGLKAKGLAGVLTDVALASEKTNVNVLKLIPATRGGLAAMILTGTGTNDYKQILLSLNDAMAGRVHPTLDAFRRMQQQVSFQAGQLGNTLQVLAITIGQILLPPLISLVQFITPIVQAVTNWAKEHPQLTAALVKGAAALGLFTVSFGALSKLFSVFKPLLAPIILALSDFAVPLGLVAAAATALYVAWNKNFLGIQQATLPVWHAIKPVLGDLKNALGDLFKGITTGKWGPFEHDIQQLTGDLGKLKTAVWNAMQTIGSHLSWQGFKDFGEWLKTNIPKGAQWLQVHLEMVLDGIKNVAGVIGNWIRLNVPKGAAWLGIHLQMVLDTIVNIAEVVGGWLRTNVPRGAEWLKVHLEMAFKFAGNLAETIGKWVAENAPKAGSAIAATIQLGFKFAGNLAETITNWIKQNAPKAGSAIAATVELAARFVGDLAGQVRAWLATNIPRAADWLAVHIPMVLNYLGNIKDDVTRWLATNVPKGAQWAMVHIGMALDFLGSVKDQVTAWIAKNAPKAGDWLKVHIPLAIDSAEHMAGQVWALLTPIGATIAKWVRENAPTIGATMGGIAKFVLSEIGKGAGQIGNKLGTWVTAFSNWIGPAATTFLKNWPFLLNHVLDLIANAVGPIAEKLLNWGGAFIKWIAPRLPEIAANLLKISAAITLFIAETVLVIANKVTLWGLRFIGWIIPRIPDMITNLGVFTKALGNYITGPMWKDLTGALDMLANAAAAWVKPGWDRLSGQLGQFKDKLVGYFSAAGTWLYNAGKDIIQGLINGMGSMAGALKDWMINAAKNLVEAPFKKALSLFSPSRVFFDHGTNVMHGLIQGMESQKGALTSSMNGIARQVAGFGGPAAGGPTAGYSAASVAAQQQQPLQIYLYLDGKQLTDNVLQHLAVGQKMMPGLV